MANWVDVKYVGLISGRLERFRRTGDNVWVFRCCICGDSAKSKSKTRGYIYETPKGNLQFKCHNCDACLGIEDFIKLVDPYLFGEYLKEKIKEKYLAKGEGAKPEVKEPLDKLLFDSRPKFMKDGPLKKIKKVSQLNPVHPCKLYVMGRRIPTEYHYKLYYCEKFKAWVNAFIEPNKFEDTKIDESRLIIPFIDQEGDMIGFQGRSLKPDAPDRLRYITIMVDKTKPRLFGLDTVDFSKKVRILEGPIDSMFVSNALATAGGDMRRELDLLSQNEDAFVIVYDNEPRSPHTVKKIRKAVEDGYSVAIWPDDIAYKDVNDMVDRGGMSIKQIDHIIRDNTFSGLMALARLNDWKKVD